MTEQPEPELTSAEATAAAAGNGAASKPKPDLELVRIHNLLAETRMAVGAVELLAVAGMALTVLAAAAVIGVVRRSRT